MPKDHSYLQALLKERSGVVLAADKPNLVKSRLLPVARAAGLADVPSLISRLKKPDADALTVAVVEAMMTSESSFFRDRTSFIQFRKTIMPTLIAARATTRSIRIWCAAAAGGQELYTIAICLKEMAKELNGIKIEIVATDLSTEVLKKAESGTYTQLEAQRGMPALMLIKYFSKVGEMWQVNAEIRAMVRFMPFNLLNDFSSLGIFDVVFCRNVLIYFDRDTKADVLKRIADVTAPDGYLVMGGTESLLGSAERFKPLPGQHGLYAPQPEPLAASGNVISFAAARAGSDFAGVDGLKA